MSRFIVLFAVFALASGAVLIPSIQIENAAENLIDFSVDEKPDWWKAFQPTNFSIGNEETNEVTDLFSLAHLTAVASEEKLDDTIRYTLGKRVKNDRLVGQGGDIKRWTTPQDATLNLRYPASGQGATVTYVEIVIGQSSNLGQAKLIAGGIGQRSVTIVVTARNTYWLAYGAYFYGL